jgi:hypothetical protein
VSANAKWLAAWPLLPLALALGGVAWRTHVAPRSAPEHATAHAQAYTPPAWILAAAHGAAQDASFTVDPARSRAFVCGADGTSAAVDYEVQGRLRLLADEALGGAEFLLVPKTGPNGAHRALRLQLGVARTSSSAIPGFHTSRPLAQLSSDGERRPIVLSATWMRLPGGRLQVHAVSEPAEGLAELLRRPRRERTPWARGSRAVVSLVMELVEQPAR